MLYFPRKSVVSVSVFELARAHVISAEGDGASALRMWPWLMQVFGYRPENLAKLPSRLVKMM